MDTSIPPCGCRTPDPLFAFDDNGDNQGTCVGCGGILKLPSGDVLDPHTTSTLESTNVRRFELNLSWPRSALYCDRIDGYKHLNGIIDGILRSRPLRDTPVCLPTVAPRRIENSSQGQQVKPEWVPKEYSYSEIRGIYDPNDNPDKLEHVEFRILELSKGNPEDPLRGRLKTVTIGDKHPYAALSYTWADNAGDSKRSRPLFLGKKCHRLSITANCEAALRCLRYTDRTRPLWIDAICINQNSDDDKRAQILIMNYIYSRASSVLIFLDDNSDLVHDILREINEDRDPTIKEDPSEKDMERMSALFALPYFRRVWVLQEIALAQAVWIHTPRIRVLWNSFRLIGNAPRKCPIVPASLWQCRAVQNRSLSHLAQWLLSGLGLQASRPEDKVFAFFGIVENLPALGLVADYRLALEQVYTGIAAFLIQDPGSFGEVLRHANGCGPAGFGRPIDLPSWVPDFRSDRNAPESDMRAALTNTVLRTNKTRRVDILRQTGTLVIYGFRLAIEEKPGQDRNEKEIQETIPAAENTWFKGGKFRVESKHKFDWTTDLIFIPFRMGKDSSAEALHLRSLNNDACYTFIGYCNLFIHESIIEAKREMCFHILRDGEEGWLPVDPEDPFHRDNGEEGWLPVDPEDGSHMDYALEILLHHFPVPPSRSGLYKLAAHLNSRQDLPVIEKHFSEVLLPFPNRRLGRSLYKLTEPDFRHLLLLHSLHEYIKAEGKKARNQSEVNKWTYEDYLDFCLGSSTSDNLGATSQNGNMEECFRFWESDTTFWTQIGIFAGFSRLFDKHRSQYTGKRHIWIQEKDVAQHRLQALIGPLFTSEMHNQAACGEFPEEDLLHTAVEGISSWQKAFEDMLSSLPVVPAGFFLPNIADYFLPNIAGNQHLFTTDSWLSHKSFFKDLKNLLQSNIGKIREICGQTGATRERVVDWLMGDWTAIEKKLWCILAVLEATEDEKKALKGWEMIRLKLITGGHWNSHSGITSGEEEAVFIV